MEAIRNEYSEANKIKKILDIQADLLNKKFAQLFFSNDEFAIDDEDEFVERKKRRNNKNPVKMILLPNLKFAV